MSAVSAVAREFVTLKADRFDTGEREHYVNTCCRGEDFVRWLHSKLARVLPEPPKVLYQEGRFRLGDRLSAPGRRRRGDGGGGVLRAGRAAAVPPLCANVDTRITTTTSLFRKARKAKLLDRKDETIRRIDGILQQGHDFQDVRWWHEGPVCGAPAARPDA